jgi:preprotein translocase subunit SecF
MVSNPFANLGVATQAAKMQAEESNISLANTLDTLRATGASAGGATALAQAAFQSKQGVSASIEKQEADNEKLKAQGEADKQAKKMEEAQRLQQAKYMEGVRTQTAETEGIKFKYGEQESRDIAKLNRLAGQEAQAKQNEAAAKQAKGAAIGGMISSIGSIAGGFASGGATGGATGG